MHTRPDSTMDCWTESRCIIAVDTTRVTTSLVQIHRGKAKGSDTVFMSPSILGHGGMECVDPLKGIQCAVADAIGADIGGTGTLRWTTLFMAASTIGCSRSEQWRDGILMNMNEDRIGWMKGNDGGH